MNDLASMACLDEEEVTVTVALAYGPIALHITLPFICTRCGMMLRIIAINVPRVTGMIVVFLKH